MPHEPSLRPHKKTVLTGAEPRNGRMHYLTTTVYLNGRPVWCANTQEYMRVLGRHALPHLFHLDHMWFAWFPPTHNANVGGFHVGLNWDGLARP